MGLCICFFVNDINDECKIHILWCLFSKCVVVLFLVLWCVRLSLCTVRFNWWSFARVKVVQCLYWSCILELLSTEFKYFLAFVRRGGRRKPFHDQRVCIYISHLLYWPSGKFPVRSNVGEVLTRVAGCRCCIFCTIDRYVRLKGVFIVRRLELYMSWRYKNDRYYYHYYYYYYYY